MTGYFSQLARYAGLSLEPGATKTTSSFATAPTVAVQRLESALLAPPHVEEITFTAAPAPAAFEEDSNGLAGGASVGANSLVDRDSTAAGTTDGRNPKQTESKDDDHPRSAAATAKRLIDVSPDPSWEASRIASTGLESGTRDPREQSAEVYSPASETQVIRPDERSGAEQQPGPPESIEMVESQFAAQGAQAQGRHALRHEAQDSDQPPARVRESAVAVRDVHLEREMIVHSYLKEVRAWVATPPELDQRELQRQRSAERLPAGHTNAFALESAVEPTVPRPGRPETLEVQDLNLSIGTISIVIEEPKQTAPAALPAPPKVDRSPERPASEPTRLSRFYLARW